MVGEGGHSMPICIHCATPLDSLYLRYGRDHIVLSPCTSSICSSPSNTTLTPADPYLEHSLTVVILDLILAKPKAYRHLLFNRSSIFALSGHGGGGGLAKRWFALSLVDAYIRWFYLCVQPPLSHFADTPIGGTRERFGERVVRWIGEWIPLQAGIFFPSLFTPTASPSLLGEEGAIAAVCSSTPIIFTTSNTDELVGHQDILPTLISYLNVLSITLIESLALHISVTLLIRKTGFVRDPWLPSKALLLSQLSPLILLTFVLLWSTKFPHSKPIPTTEQVVPPPEIQTGWMVWIIRTFLTSLNAGVAIGTVLPQTNSAMWWPPLLLAFGWSAQTLTSLGLYSLLSQ